MKLRPKISYNDQAIEKGQLDKEEFLKRLKNQRKKLISKRPKR